VDETPTPTWPELIILMSYGPPVVSTARGIIRGCDGTDESRGHFGCARFEDDPEPVLVGARLGIGVDATDQVRVWIDGVNLRVEELDGSPNFIANATTCWQFDRSQEAPVASPVSAVRFLGGASSLLERKEISDWSGTEFTQPTGPVGRTTLLGRPCWTVELAPPKRKPFPMQLVVDAHSGLVLQQRTDGFGSIDEWTEIEFDQPLSGDLFTWTGPSRSYEEIERAHRARSDAELAERDQWFLANVAPKPLTLEVEAPVQLSYRRKNGAFEGGLGRSVQLARRPRKSSKWKLGWSSVTYKWSDQHWDWAIATWGDESLTRAGLKSLQSQLGSKALPGKGPRIR
jgi:hypothetical protein